MGFILINPLPPASIVIDYPLFDCTTSPVVVFRNHLPIMEVLKATQGKITGVIIPPPEIRAVVDRTASYVAKIGKSFEQRVLASEEGKTAKFNFMKPFDPYHAYYELKIRESEEGKTSTGPTEETKSSNEAAPAHTTATEQSTEKAKAAPTAVATTVKASIVNPIAQLAQTKPTEPPPELEFSVAQSHPAGLTPLDIDIIKLSAQYTAVNGREFLANLALREQRNPQFDFLKPTHMLFSYFTYLVDCYAKIVHPSASLRDTIKAKSQWSNAMEGAVRRWQWTRAEAERKRAESSEDSAERLAFQAIDWFDFTVVETIDFPADELLELPGLGAGVTALDLAGNSSSINSFNSFSNNSNSFNSDNSGVSAVAPPPPPPAKKATTAATTSSTSSYYAPAPAEEHSAAMDVEGGASGSSSSAAQNKVVVQEEEEDDLSDLKVVTDYQHHSSSSAGSSRAGASAAGAGAGGGLMMVDPISGKAIPVDQLTEHMRVQLLDPRWREQQQRFVEKQKETGFAEGGSIADSLKMFARKRGDIFGQAATGAGPNTAAAIAEQEALEQRKHEIQSQVQWDGHYGTIGGVQQLKHELAHKAPAAFALPAGAVKQAPSIGPSSSAPVVAHYSLPAVPVPAAPTGAGAVPTGVISLPTIPLSASSAAAVPPPPPLVAPNTVMGMGSGMMPPPPPPLLPFGAPAIPAIPGAYVGGMPPLPPPALFPAGAADVAGAGAIGAEPASKRAKTAGGDSAAEPELIPAAEFAARHPQPVNLTVQLPSDTSAPAAWNLSGGSLSLAVPVTHTVKQLKEALSPLLGGMPASKQQVKYPVFGFLKDANTLAELNIGEGAVLELSAKSRGGKR